MNCFYHCVRNLKILILILGKFSDDKDKKDAVVILEKKPFDLKDVKPILSGETEAEVHLQNDIYSSADLFPNASLNGKYNCEVFFYCALFPFYIGNELHQ